MIDEADKYGTPFTTEDMNTGSATGSEDRSRVMTASEKTRGHAS